MTWDQFWHGESVAGALLVLGLVIICGLALGHLRIRKVGLGVAGILFAGLAFGHFGATLPKETLDFVRDFGLLLFVYGIGLHVGPAFWSSIKSAGRTLNVLALGIVVMGAILTVVLGRLAHIPAGVAVGLFSGATTNTPSLAAAQEALKGSMGADTSAMAGVGYAVAYPFGVGGIILTMLIFRTFLKNVPEDDSVRDTLEVRNLRVTREAVIGMPLAAVVGDGVAVSRHLSDRRLQIPSSDQVLRRGDVLLAVGPQPALENLQANVGDTSALDLRDWTSDIEAKPLLVTRADVVGKTLGDLGLLERPNMAVTRLARVGVEITPRPDTKLQFGDCLTVVGRDEEFKQVAAKVGDALKELNEPRLAPLFAGLLAGVALGSIPFPVPGLPTGLKLGLAGGPLLAALILSRVGKIGPLIFYMPPTALAALREVGIGLFLACAGLKAGAHFAEAFAGGQGPIWLLCGAVITMLPLVVAGILGRIWLKLPFPTLCGLWSGGMTDPPALAFARTINTTEAPSLAYATVYPLVMLGRIVAAQILALCAANWFG